MCILKYKISFAIAATLFFTFNSSLGSSLQYTIGLGIGISHFEFNADKKDSNFISNMNGKEMLRTTYKYIGNHPQKNIHFELGVHKGFENARFFERNFFFGANVAAGFGKVKAAQGLLNPNVSYLNTGSIANYYSINSKFGLENSFSKIYGMLGLAYVKASLPFDILPQGDNSSFGDLGTCAAMGVGSPVRERGTALAALIGQFIAGGDNLPEAAKKANAALSQFDMACSSIKVKDASYGTFFISLGVGTEFNFIRHINLFWEYNYLMQLNRSRHHSVDYTIAGKAGSFTGKIIVKNTQFVKFGARYYF